MRSPLTPFSPNSTTTDEVVPVETARLVAQECDLLADSSFLVPELRADLEPELGRVYELLPAGEERAVHALDLVRAADPQARGLPLVFSVVVDGSHGRVDVELEFGGGVVVELTALGVGRSRHPTGLPSAHAAHQ